ncbi:MAG: type II secretion system protein [Halofilum sp. (in: g-proteobacteria)]
MNERGFTVIELVATMVIIAALSVFVLPRLDLAAFERADFRQQVLSALRYAQKAATASGCEVAVDLDSGGNRYGVLVRSGATGGQSCGSAGFTEYLRHPARNGDYTGQAESATDLQTNGRIVFDGFGAYDADDSSVPSPPLVTVSGATIRIDPVTGYVHE